MKRYVCLMILFVGFSYTAFSQKTDLNEYSYIIVPKKFDFLHEEDQFQLNSLTKFLLNKHGFIALFNTEVPDNVRRCDGLWAEVLKSSGLVYTNLEVVIKDCKGNELYRSVKGKSKFKQYQKAYQDALRKAFKSFQSLNVDQQDLVILEETGLKEITNENKTVVSSAVTKKDELLDLNSNNEYIPDSSFSVYSNNNKLYLLRKIKIGYTFYEESSQGDLILVGSLSVNGSKLKYLNRDGVTYDAYFDASSNLNIFIGEKPSVYLFNYQ